MDLSGPAVSIWSTFYQLLQRDERMTETNKTIPNYSLRSGCSNGQPKGEKGQSISVVVFLECSFVLFSAITGLISKVSPKVSKK